MKKNTYRIFLASSNELADERLRFGNFILHQNKRLAEKNVSLHLEVWEDMDDAFNTTCKQEDYNEYLRKCQLCVVLFWTKVGKYTNQEFDLAYQLYKETGEPRVYVYEKTASPEKEPKEWEAESKKVFLEKINPPGQEQFQSTFANFAELENRFKRSLDDLFTKGILTYGSPATLLSPKGVDNPNVFVGREDELKLISQKLKKGGKLMLINAEGGIGKTTLAARYWNESLYEYQHNAWLFCENGIVNALKELAPKLNVDLTGLDEAQQLKKLRDALSQVHDDFLLVLDNANDKDDIQIFKQEFAGFHWHVLITSRCQGVLEKEQELPITHLPPPLAKELFEKYYREDSPEFDALLDRLLEAIRYHTLLVELFAKNLNEASELGTTLAEFLQKLETGGLYLGEDSFEIQTSYTEYVQKVAATTDDILNILYDFTTLSEAQRYLLVNLAMLPAENYTLLFLIELLAPADQKAFRDTIRNLYHKGWLSAMEKTYRLSPVVQELVLKKNADTLPADAEILLQNLGEKLDNDGANFTHLTLTQAVPFALLASSITQRLQQSPTYELASLNFNAGLYFENIGDVVKAKQAYAQYGQLSAAIGHVEAVAISYSKLGGIYEVTGDWKNALDNYQERKRIGLEIYQSSPENLSYKNGLAISYSKLGGIYEATGDWKNALDNYQERKRIGLEIYQSSPENLSYKNGLAISYSKLGGIYEATGDWKNALDNYQERKRIGLEIYQSSPENLSYKNGLAISYSKLGGIYEATGDWKNALDNYQAQLRIFKEIYQSSPENLSYKNGLAISYSKLGGIYEATGDWKNALDNYQEDFRITKEIYQSSPENLSYKNGLAISYSKLGGIYEATGDWKNALDNYQAQLRIFKEIYQSSPENLSYKNGLAISYEKLGGIYEATGDWKNALDNYQERKRIGLEIYQSSPENLPYKNGLAISYSKLGGIYEATGDWKNALDNYQAQLRIFKEIYQSSPENLSYKNGLAISYSKLGGIYEATGDWKNALDNYQEDFRITKEIYQSSPENLSYKNGLAISYEKLGGIYEATGDWKNALDNYQERKRIGLEIYQSSPENLPYKNGLAISYEKLGGIYEATGDWKNALDNYQEDFRITKEIYQSSPENLSYKNGLAISYEKLGGIYEATGDWKNALDNYQERKRISLEIYQSSPENLSYKNGLAISYSKLGGIYEATGDWKNALDNYQERKRISLEIYQSSPENLSYKNGLAISYARLGSFYLKQNDISESLSHFMESRTLFGELWAATHGRIVQFTFYFTMNSRDVSRLVKWMIQNGYYESNVVPELTKQIKQMRREGYEALKPLAEAGVLHENQTWLVDELADKGWYDF